jgi:hypothetical protein
VRVYVYPADEAGCGQYRLLMAARVLREQGHDVTIELPSDRDTIRGVIDPTTKRLVRVQVPPDADVVVMQRLTFAPMAHAVAMIRAQGVAVAVDMDDDLSTIHPANSAYAKYQPETGGLHSYRNAAVACETATLVTTSTPGLQQVYARHGRGRVIDNHVPAAYLDIPRVDSDVIGWAGTIASHPDDLQTVGMAVRRLVGEGHEFRVVGPPYGIKAALDLPEIPPSTGVVSFDRWAQTVAGIGVGMVPLADTVFNRSKSRLKGLEMAAIGVPWVASPRAEYQRLHKLGVGMLARKPLQWYSRLKELATNAALREEMSQAGRAVAAEHTVEANAWRWWEAWSEALRIERAAYRPAAAPRSGSQRRHPPS